MTSYVGQEYRIAHRHEHGLTNEHIVVMQYTGVKTESPNPFVVLHRTFQGGPIVPLPRREENYLSGHIHIQKPVREITQDGLQKPTRGIKEVNSLRECDTLDEAIAEAQKLAEEKGVVAMVQKDFIGNRAEVSWHPEGWTPVDDTPIGQYIEENFGDVIIDKKEFKKDLI